MRHIITFLLLFLIILSTLYILKINLKKNSFKRYKNVNLLFDKKYQQNKKEIEKYRLGIPLSEYNNNIYSNNYRLHPQSFIPGFRKPIDGILPDDYESNLSKENIMYAQLNCKSKNENCMDMKNDYSDLLNKN
jgi:hypothetical protein